MATLIQVRVMVRSIIDGYLDLGQGHSTLGLGLAHMPQIVASVLG